MAQYETIPFTNISDTNFSFQYEKEEYSIKAGQTKYWPSFICVHGAKHLIDREIIRKGKIADLNNPEERGKLQEKILNSVGVIQKDEPDVVHPEVDKELREIGHDIEEEFPDLSKLDKASMPEKRLVDLKRGELFAKVKQLGLKVKATISNDELRRIIQAA